MTLTFVTDFCAVKVRQISIYECFANFLNGDQRPWKSIGNISPLIDANNSDLNLCDGFLCSKSSVNKHI